MKKNLPLMVLMLGLLIGLLQSLPASGQMEKTEAYSGMKDASGAVALDERTFIVANDEDNYLRIFSKTKPNDPQIFKLSEVFKDSIFDGDNLEIDLEGAARIGDKIFWLGSHSTNKNAKPRPARHRLFAIQAFRGPDNSFTIAAVGQIYTNLIRDLEKDPRFASYKFNEAKAVAPKAIGGLSIEGLAATPDGGLLIGFRNPLSGGQTVNGFLVGAKALIIKLLNPLEVIDGKEARFDAPIELDFGGYGVRSLEYYPARQKFLIAAGPYHENEETSSHKKEVSRLYLWSGKIADAPKLLKNIDLTGFNVEAAFFFPNLKHSIELFSDDGTTATTNSFRAILKKLK